MGFDTATDVGTVGLAKEGQTMGSFSFRATESQSERLLKSIDLLLTETDHKITEVEKIAVSRGPGSFTGLRIGISTAKGLAHGLQVPLVGIPLTKCYYSRVENYPGPVCTLITDRRNLVYLAVFDRTGKKIIEEESIGIENLEEKLTTRLGNQRETVLLVGDGVPNHRSQLSELKGTTLANGELNYPSGLQIALLAENVPETGKELMSLEPLYAQRPIAEINWNSNQGDKNG